MADSYDRDAWSKRANEIRARIPVSTVVGRVVELKKRGNEHTGLCPFHNERTASFTVNDKKGFFHCFGCGQHGDALAFVMQRQGLDFQAAVQLLESEGGLRHLQLARPAPPAPKVRQAEDVKKDEAVARIWRESVPLDRGGVVDRYLRGRAIVPPSDYGVGAADLNGGWPVDLRFCAELWHGEERQRMPGMVAAMRRGGAVVAVHRTYLKVTGVGVTKAGTSRDKAMFGDVAGSFILLGPIDGRMLGGEGIETSLSAMQLYRRSGLAFGARAGMATVEPPFECSDFIYAADKNKVHPDPAKSRVGEAAAWKGARAFGTGRRVQVKVPNLVAETGDFNDMLRDLAQRQAAGAAAQRSPGSLHGSEQTPIVARGGPSPVIPAGDRRAAPLPPATPSAKVPA